MPPSPNLQDLRIIFAGTPEFAAEHLQALLDAPYALVGVFTQPDRPAGRGKKCLPGPVKALASEYKVPVFQPVTLKKSTDQLALSELRPDLMVVVAYGLILPPAVLTIPRLGCINVHASLLPRWRGAAPIQRAIEFGDEVSGITIMQMEEGLDTGPMLATTTCPIASNETGGSLHDKLVQLGPQLLLQTIDKMVQDGIKADVQNNDQVTYAPKLTKKEGAIDWILSAVEIDRKVRAFNLFPVAYSVIGGQRVRIWSGISLNDLGGPGQQTENRPAGSIISVSEQGILVACGKGVYRIDELQLAGRKRLPVGEVLKSRAALFSPGLQFDAAP